MKVSVLPIALILATLFGGCANVTDLTLQAKASAIKVSVPIGETDRKTKVKPVTGPIVAAAKDAVKGDLSRAVRRLRVNRVYVGVTGRTDFLGSNSPLLQANRDSVTTCSGEAFADCGQGDEVVTTKSDE